MTVSVLIVGIEFSGENWRQIELKSWRASRSSSRVGLEAKIDGSKEGKLRFHYGKNNFWIRFE